MSGIQEILLLLIILLAIVLLPRVLARRETAESGRSLPSLSWKMRLTIALSLLWPAAMAAYMKPWQEDPVKFAYIGLGPVAVGWLVYWVAGGSKK